MRFLTCLLLARVAMAGSYDDLRAVEVLIPGAFAPMDRVYYSAEEIAANIFSQIGLKVRWRLLAPATAECSVNPKSSTVAVAFSWNTPDSFHPGAWAISNPAVTRGACVTVFMDRLRPMGAGNPANISFLLGHILAHEIGHVLQGICRHSDEGVLKARWSAAEIRSMARRPLRFTPDDAALIFAGLRRDPNPH